MKVTLITVVSKAETQTEFNNSVQRALPQGTGELVEKQNDGIQGTLDLSNNRHTHRVFKRSKKHEFGSTPVIGIGLEPEKKEVFATVRRELRGGNVSRAHSEAAVGKT